jgi:hypothetical protein
MNEFYKITPELQQIDHGGEAAMTWSQSDHHPSEARIMAKP